MSDDEKVARQLENEFLIKKGAQNQVFAIGTHTPHSIYTSAMRQNHDSTESIDSYPIDCDAINALSTTIITNSSSIKKLKLHLCVDRGYKYDDDILEEVISSCTGLFNAISSLTDTLEIFEINTLRLPHSMIKYFFDSIIMNEQIIFKRLYSLSININEYLLMFLKYYHLSDNQSVESKYKNLNIYSSFLVRHKVSITDISIQVTLSPNHIMSSISNNQLNNIQILQNILSILMWRLLGSIYYSEIQLRYFYLFCRYNVEITKFMPLLEHMINGNCTERLHTFSLNISHLQSAHSCMIIQRLLQVMITHCNQQKLKHFKLNALDIADAANSYNAYLKHKFLTLSNNANKCLQKFIKHFVNLEDLSLNMAQFALYQYHQFIETVSKSEIKKLYLGDSVIPSVSSSFDLYDDMNIFQKFVKLIDNGQNMKMIQVEIHKSDVVARFVKRNTILVDAIHKLYSDVNKGVRVIDSELQKRCYPKDIILLIIEYAYNCDDALVISFEGAASLSDCEEYIKQQIQENNEIYLAKSGVNLPQKHIELRINGTIVLSTDPNQCENDKIEHLF